MPETVPAQNAPRPAESGALHRVLVFAAIAVLLAGLGSLGVILAGAMAGTPVWTGFMGLAWFCFPIAFVLMVLLMAGSIRRRRSS
ncbi:hypothetical protein ACMX2H_15695 [Arthrobacter sulfonylureivorans]|uniref:hypothetical protein n=1 Tax=Arthrobacter sulfonylureivorans TaxID=2486855 RepID=UPI0039E3C118